MQIVIKVPDDFYERVNKDGCMSYTDAEVVVDAFYLGKVLPKGHGRLIDGDILKKQNCCSESYVKLFTIIEADTEVDDGA